MGVKAMSNIKLPSIGEYVLVTEWGDKNPLDPWFVGHLFRISIYKHHRTFTVDEDESRREYKHCFKITEEEGKRWVELYGNKEDV